MNDATNLCRFLCPECGEVMELNQCRAGDAICCVGCGSWCHIPFEIGVQVALEDRGLISTEWLLYGILFLTVPLANILVGYFLSQQWETVQPRKAQQIGVLGLLFFSLHLLLLCILPVLLATL